MNWDTIWSKLKQYYKYVITLIIFLVVYLFIGDQSMIKRIKRNHQIRITQEQLSVSREATKEAQHIMSELQSTDSLERFAREHYHMHTKGEDIYIVDE